jgi:hypothetical protein
LEGDYFSNSNQETFDRIGFIPYETLNDDVHIASGMDVMMFGTASDAAYTQIEDDQGRTFGGSAEGSNVPIIENAMMLPAFGESDPEAPEIFAMPTADHYKVNIFGTGDGTYDASILGGRQNYAITDTEVNEGTLDTLSVQSGPEGRQFVFFSTSDDEKPYTLLVDDQGEDSEGGTQNFYRIDSVIRSDSEALFSIDPWLHTLQYTNRGRTGEITYTVQIFAVLSEESQTLPNDLVIRYNPVTEPYTFTIGALETHTIYVDDWENVTSHSEITAETVGECGNDHQEGNENSLNCPEDVHGISDMYCDGISDDICDPDCTAETDPDCADASDGGDGGLPGGCVPTAADMIPLALISMTLVGLSVRRWRGRGS